MTVTAQARRNISAPKEVVWAVLDDFAGISAWSAGIQKSYTTGSDGRETGLGAERRCELGGKKVLDERISAYQEGDSMTVDVWNIEGLPLNSSKAKFSIRSTGSGSSEVVIDAVAEPKLPDLVQKIMSPLLSKGISKNFGGLLDELAAEAEKQATR